MSELFLIALGSNIDPVSNLPRAVSELMNLGVIKAISQVYETTPVGPPGQPQFVNAAVALESEHSPASLRDQLRHIEANLGRERNEDPYQPRPIDLDISMVGSQQRTGSATPDPEVLERGYLAQVLAEVAPDLKHPGTDETLRQIAARLVSATESRARPDLRELVARLIEDDTGKQSVAVQDRGVN